MNIGANLSRARNAAGLTQDKLAEALEVSFQTVSNWERGENLPDVPHLVRAAEVLNVSVDTLTGENFVLPDLREKFFDEGSMYTRVKVVAESCRLSQTLLSLPYAREKHAAQMRKSLRGMEIPYIYHPLTMACHALAMGLVDDDVLSAILLHDVYEDCGVKLEELPVGEAVREAVRLLSHNSYEGPDEVTDPVYYENIGKNPLAALVKCVDRCQNLSSMALGFRREKIASYIQGTEKFVLPILSNLDKLNPAWSGAAWLMRYQMYSLLEMAKRML